MSTHYQDRISVLGINQNTVFTHEEPYPVFDNFVDEYFFEQSMFYGQMIWLSDLVGGAITVHDQIMSVLSDPPKRRGLFGRKPMNLKFDVKLDTLTKHNGDKFVVYTFIVTRRV